jgi:DNA repair exonuclease SbcCD ATPase subunit
VIRRVRLENWRAYRQLDLPVDPGVTFLVGANGVGKTSLLEAVRWTLSPGVVPGDRTVIRHGHDEATATVTLLSDHGELEVRRVMRRHRSRELSSFDATLNGRKLNEPDFGRMLAKAWSADLAFVSKTAFLTEDLRVEEAEPDLRAHLCQVYSLDELQRALAEIGPALSQANREVKAARGELTATADQLNTARQERARLQERLEAARSKVSEARERHADTLQAADQALAAQRLRAAAAAWDQRSAGLRQDIDGVTGAPADKASLEQAVRRAKLTVRREVETARTEQARLSARLEAVEEALTRLRAAGAQCPVCLRALDGPSRGRAEHIHSESLTDLREQLDAADPQPLVERLRKVEALELRVAALPERPVPEEPGNVEAADADVATAEADLDRAARDLTDLEVAARLADQHIDQIVTELAETEHLTRRYREVALLEAAERALNSTISSILSEQLAPLASEVNRRWQTVFPDRPNLKLMPDGTISRDAGGSPLAFTAFSAGEKMVARLMMRLTTLLVTTKVPFCWVDEPLEHLDPRSRHLVGSMLAHLSTTPGLEQLFVTTYEEPLARRLAEFQPGRVRVEYLRTEHVA